MEITEVRIKLTQLVDDRLQAFCSITFDNAFVVRDLKIIDGPQGPFVAMPSRKIMGHCQSCGYKNHLRSAYCNQCGAKQKYSDVRDSEGRAKLYADIAHPINAQSRDMIQRRVVQAYRDELERAKQPGYVSRYDEDFDDPGHDGHGPAAVNAQLRSDAAHDVTHRTDANQITERITPTRMETQSEE